MSRTGQDRAHTSHTCRLGAGERPPWECSSSAPRPVSPLSRGQHAFHGFSTDLKGKERRMEKPLSFPPGMGTPRPNVPTMPTPHCLSCVRPLAPSASSPAHTIPNQRDRLGFWHL